jgi:SAM-dependent methyltransferase
MNTLLHVGCGSRHIQNLPPLFQMGDWDEIRYDIDPNAEPDIVGSLQDMSLVEDASVEAIYSSHNIEHVWAFEVQGVLKEFRRVLKPEGFALILCPDMLSVAQAIRDGFLEKAVYESPAGPITALDIVYGYHSDIEAGNHYMAHKTAFTSETLAKHLERAGFASAIIVRDYLLGLHALALPPGWQVDHANEVLHGLMPHNDAIVETLRYGAIVG